MYTDCNEVIVAALVVWLWRHVFMYSRHNKL